MAKIDEIKTHIDWLKDIFKILIAVLVADVAGVSKLYINNNFNLLFYGGVILIIILSILAAITSKKIDENIKKLGDL